MADELRSDIFKEVTRGHARRELSVEALKNIVGKRIASENEFWRSLSAVDKEYIGDAVSQGAAQTYYSTNHFIITDGRLASFLESGSSDIRAIPRQYFRKLTILVNWHETAEDYGAGVNSGPRWSAFRSTVLSMEMLAQLDPDLIVQTCNTREDCMDTERLFCYNVLEGIRIPVSLDG